MQTTPRPGFTSLSSFRHIPNHSLETCLDPPRAAVARTESVTRVPLRGGARTARAPRSRTEVQNASDGEIDCRPVRLDCWMIPAA
jgi:hypothetical protein